MQKVLQLGLCLALLGTGCDTQERSLGNDDEGHGATDAGSVDGGDRDDAGTQLGGLMPDSEPDAQVAELFDQPGQHFWFEVNDDELSRMNGGGSVFGGRGGDIYDPSGDATFADRVLLQDPDAQHVFDFGKVQVRLVGNETFRQWDITHIPNLRIDADEFQTGMRIGSFEHFRLNNSLTGTIFREHMAHEIFRALGYPALRSTYAWVGSNVWGQHSWVPMTLIEVYKRRFCKDNEKLLGGTCKNMWEFGSDVAQEIPPDACQVSSCDNSVLETLGATLRGTPKGAGFQKKLDKLVDWPRFHEYQCLSWILGMPDDPIHAGNNNLIIERETDHRLIWFPYSVDISQGNMWSQGVGLTGSTPLAQGCQSDPTCWKETLATCKKLITKLAEVKPEEMLDKTVSSLESLGMLRDGDTERAMELRAWYVSRHTTLPKDLEYFKHIPDAWGFCEEGLTRCDDGGCAKEIDCMARRCDSERPWCPARRTCVSRKYDECPSCPKSKPFYCGVNDECIADEIECTQMCIDTVGEGTTYCSLFGACVPDGNCYDNGGGGGGGPIID